MPSVSAFLLSTAGFCFKAVMNVASSLIECDAEDAILTGRCYASIAEIAANKEVIRGSWALQ